MARASATDGLVVLSTAADRCYDQAVAPCPLMSEEQLNAFLDKVKDERARAIFKNLIARISRLESAVFPNESDPYAQKFRGF